jgi:biotin carboxyl carrier protein
MNYQQAPGWIPLSNFPKASPLTHMGMSPTDFIDVEITGHAKGSSSSSSSNKKENNKKSEEETKRQKDILMPAISPTMTSGKVVEWLVKTGDTIRKGEPIMVIESEKEIQGARGYRMNQDVNANVDGVLAAIYQQPGQEVDVGAVLGVIVPDFIIDAEIDNGNNATEASEISPSMTNASNTVADRLSDTQVPTAAGDSPVATDTPSADNTPYTVISTAEETEEPKSKSEHFFSSPSPSSDSANEMLDHTVPSTTSDANVAPFAATSNSKSGPDWVHGHHAESDGMMNDHQFYSSEVASPLFSKADENSFPRSNTQDERDAFYDPVHMNHHPPHVPPPMNPNINAAPKAKMERDSFYEAYRGEFPLPSLEDPYAEQVAQWHQQANNGMGAYYQAERNGQSFSSVEQDVVITPHFEQNPISEVSRRHINDGNSNSAHTDNTAGAFVNSALEPPIIHNETQSFINRKTHSETMVGKGATQHTPNISMKDDERVVAMESRIASVEKSLQNQDISTSSSDTKPKNIQTELDTLKGSLDILKREYHQNIKKLEESYQSSLLQVGNDFSSTMEELRDWDSITVTWDIQDFEKSLQRDLTTYTSEEFTVAGYSMTLEMQIFGQNDDASRDVGFYIMHTGGLNFVPIMIGGSKITIQSSCTEDSIKVFVDDASIEDSHYGWGWKKFFSLADLKQSFVNSKGEIQVTATVRVKRVRSCRLNTAL